MNFLPLGLLIFQGLLINGIFLAFTSHPSEYGQQHTLNILNAQTAAQHQFNGSYEARMSGKFGEWRD